jgi:hypothetical protein
MQQYLRGETPYLETKIYSKAGALVTPTSCEVFIRDPNGKVVQVTGSCTQDGTTTGVWYYAGWTVASTHVAGPYKWICIVTDGAIDTKKVGEFEVLQEGTTSTSSST